MIEDVQSDARARMQKSIEAFRTELSKIRTGRAHPSLLDHVSVDYYGTPTPINQAANVTIEDARTLAVSPFDKGMVKAIEKAILESDLGLNPSTSGTLIRIPLPPLTEERRRDLIKVVKNEAEGARVAIRNIRRDANGTLKDLEKEKEITEDEMRRAEDRIQKLTDEHVAQVESIFETKEKEMLSI